MKRKTCIFKNVAMLFIAIGLLAVFVGCNDKNDEVGPLRQEVQTLRSELTKSFDSKVDAKTKELQDQLDQAKKEIADLSKRREGMSPEQLQAKIDAATENLITITAAKAMYEEYVKNVNAQLENAVTAEQLEALRKDVDGLDAKVGTINAGLSDLSTKVGTINHKIALLETLVGDVDLGEALEKLQNDFNAQLGNKFGEFTQSLEKAVKELNQKIDSQRTEFEEMLKAYKTANDELVKANGKLANANSTEIATLKEEVSNLQTKVNNLDTALEKAQKDLKINVIPTILNSRLTSLVLLPEYVSDNGGALPVVLFAPLKTQDCGFISPDVEVKYVVNPSTVTANDIDTNNIKFVYNDPKSLGARQITSDNLKAKFVSLENGVLTVRVVGNLLNETWAVAKTNPDKRIDQLMLQVPSKDGSFVVSSDWAKIQYGSKEPEIVKHIKGSTEPYEANYLVKKTVNEAKNVATPADPKTETVVEMVWNQDLDLRTVVDAIYSDFTKTPELLNTFGLEFVFDEKYNDNGTYKDIVYELGTNNTDQQRFIKINEGHIATTVVYSKEQGYNEASIGRTPIVHVMLKKGDCIVKEGFIKLKIVKEPVAKVEKELPFKATYGAKCKDDVYNDLYVKGVFKETPVNYGMNEGHVIYRVNSQQMNEKLYYDAKMSKEDFHNKYKFDGQTGVGVGKIVEITDPQDRTSFNLVYVLNNQEVWDNAGKSVSKTATYTYGNKVYKVKIDADIARETVNLDLLIGNYWYQDSSSKKSQTTGVYNTVIHNVAVPADKATNPADATYDNNINNAFVVVNKQTKNTLNLNNAVTPANKYDDYSYEYIFDVTSNQPVRRVTGHKDGVINISVSANGKNLIAKQGSKTETIATIEAQSTTDGDVLSYNEDSELGKYLLNKEPEFMRARVVLVVKNSCGKRVDVVVKNLQDKDRFYVNFLRPINVQTVSGEYFVDAVDFGKPFTYIDMKKVAELSDWRKRVKGTDKYDFLPKNENYYKYYGVQDIKVTGKIKAKGLTIGGKDVEDILKETNVKIEQTPDRETFNGETYRFGRLTYDNNGNNLGKNFILVVPVTITYKWGQIEKIVEVEVKATSTDARKRVK